MFALASGASPNHPLANRSKRPTPALAAGGWGKEAIAEVLVRLTV